MSGDSGSLFDAAHRAVLGSGNNLVYVCPPAGWAAAPLFAEMGRHAPESPGEGRVRTLAIASTLSEAHDIRAVMVDPSFGAVHTATGLSRTERLIRSGAVTTLISTPSDALALVSRAALKLDAVQRILLFWPERSIDGGTGEDLDVLLSESGSAQRIVVTSDASRVAEFIERHARRAPTARLSRIPEAPFGPVLYAVTAGANRAATCREALDVTNRARTLVWDPYPQHAGAHGFPDVDLATAIDAAGIDDAAPYDLAIAVDLPSAEILQRLKVLAAEVLVLARASQVPYLRRLAEPLKTIRLSSEVDRARDRAFALRASLRDRIAEGNWSEQLLAVEGLMEEFDPAVIAAAALTGAPKIAPVADAATWTRVRLSLGSRDELRPGDVMGLLVNSVGLRREDVGRIDIRDKFALVEVRPEDADRVVRELSGEMLKRRRLTARLDNR